MEMTTNRSEEEILEELNRQEVTRHVPLFVFLFILCLNGTLGNAWVFYVYKTKYVSSNCRTFVLFLSLVDLFSAAVVIPIEILFITREFIFKYSSICKLSVFLNNWPTLTSGFLLLAIAIDRYRKVCKPFGWQISHSKARFMCFMTALVGLAFSWISPVTYGVQTRYDVKYDVTVSECVETDAWKQTVFPLLNNIFFALLFLGALSGIVVMYCFIAIHVRRHIKRKEALSGRRGNYAVDPLDASELTIMSGKIIVKRKDDRAVDKPQKRGPDSSDDMFCSSTSEDNHVVGEVTEQDKALVLCSIEDHIDINDADDDNNRKSIISRMLSFGRSSLALTKSMSIASNGNTINSKHQKDKGGQKQKHRTAFIMFLISLAFIVSYLPMLCILLIRTLDSTFVPSLSDDGRIAYKFFLRSYFFNCAINPVIYGVWDSRFRKHTRHLICRR